MQRPDPVKLALYHEGFTPCDYPNCHNVAVLEGYRRGWSTTSQLSRTSMITLTRACEEHQIYLLGVRAGKDTEPKEVS